MAFNFFLNKLWNLLEDHHRVCVRKEIVVNMKNFCNNVVKMNDFFPTVWLLLSNSCFCHFNSHILMRMTSYDRNKNKTQKSKCFSTDHPTIFSNKMNTNKANDHQITNGGWNTCPHYINDHFSTVHNMSLIRKRLPTHLFKHVKHCYFVLGIWQTH